MCPQPGFQQNSSPDPPAIARLVVVDQEHIVLVFMRASGYPLSGKQALLQDRYPLSMPYKNSISPLLYRMR